MTQIPTSQVVLGAALSHSPLMMIDELDAGSAGQRFLTGIDEVRHQLESSNVDTVVIVFPDHFRNFHYHHMPSFCVGLRRLSTFGDWRLPKLDRLEVDESLATNVLEGLFARGFDPAYSVDMRMDHGGAQLITMLDLDRFAIVPVFVNCAAAPLPSLTRCFQFGTAIAEAVADFSDNRRVAVLGSGGLSHTVPFPAWEALEPQDERYATFVTGLDDEQLAALEEQRIAHFTEAVRAGRVLLNEELDHTVLKSLEQGALTALLELTTEELTDRGGEGMNEIRTWITAFAAAGAGTARQVAYEPVPMWATGMGAMTFGTNVPS